MNGSDINLFLICVIFFISVIIIAYQSSDTEASTNEYNTICIDSIQYLTKNTHRGHAITVKYDSETLKPIIC